jgi:hypothetical protein
MKARRKQTAWILELAERGARRDFVGLLGEPPNALLGMGEHDCLAVHKGLSFRWHSYYGRWTNDGRRLESHIYVKTRRFLFPWVKVGRKDDIDAAIEIWGAGE